jgi:hypothetical protein
MSRILLLLAKEPILVTGVVDAIIALAIGLGLPIPVQLKGVLDGLIIGLSALYVRSQVTPNASLVIQAVAQKAAPGV